ncbi:hypothetical protein KUW19_17615 [Ferrimonas balearica]|uniref:hypothetical protein n=1 Tax=Ferrimonas balearica TaxID=44012 RepID=UPI001C95AD35|nr:hypothetical protein [Ferrimonas balearica]MBY6108282.1 hypothetical protein [Ferrimonas balearica]
MSNDKDKVLTALKNEKYQWRTVRGIARESGVPKETVYSIIMENGNEIVRSSSKAESGESLFMSRERYRETNSPLRRLAAAFKNRGD